MTSFNLRHTLDKVLYLTMILLIQCLDHALWWHDEEETFSASLAFCQANLSATGVFPHKWSIFFVCFRFLFVCFITKSFLTYLFVLPTPTLSTIYRPLWSYVCSITLGTAKFGSSYSHMRDPGIGCWFSDSSNCSHWSFEAAVLPINPNIYIDQCEPIVI